MVIITRQQAISQSLLSQTMIVSYKQSLSLAAIAILYNHIKLKYICILLRLHGISHACPSFARLLGRLLCPLLQRSNLLRRM
jgi:hypothetical protein